MKILLLSGSSREDGNTERRCFQALQQICLPGRSVPMARTTVSFLDPVQESDLTKGREYFTKLAPQGPIV
jgi:hypothetical protein